MRYVLLWEFNSTNFPYSSLRKCHLIDDLSQYIDACHIHECRYSHWYKVILVYYMTIMYIMHDACGCLVRRDLPGSMIASISLMATWYHRLMLGHEVKIPWESYQYYLSHMWKSHWLFGVEKFLSHLCGLDFGQVTAITQMCSHIRLCVSLSVWTNNVTYCCLMIPNGIIRWYEVMLT